MQLKRNVIHYWMKVYAVSSVRMYKQGRIGELDLPNASFRIIKKLYTYEYYLYLYLLHDLAFTSVDLCKS